MTFDNWYWTEFGVHPWEVLEGTDAHNQLQLARKVWDAAYEQGKTAEAELRASEIKHYVVEVITNAYENGYEGEIKDMSNEELTWDILNSTVDESITYNEILTAVVEFREEAND